MGQVKNVHLPLGWISRDGKLIIFARGVRTFAMGSISVLLALYLDKLGFSVVEIGGLLSAGTAGAAFFAFLVSLVAERFGRRRLLVVFSVLTAATGVAFIFLDNFAALAVIAFFSSFGAGGAGAGGPVQPLEQASLPETAPEDKRTDLFAVYSIVATAGVALGSLAAGLPAVFQGTFGMNEAAAYRVMFWSFSVLHVAGALIYLSLSPAVDGGEAGEHKWSNPFKLPSRKRIFTLTGLFALDHFSGSLVVQSLAVYWFNTKFGIDLKSLAVVFFLSNVLAAISLWLAAKIANRIGLLNTMVFTHIPSSLFLIGATFAPTVWVAVLFWQLRSFLGQMDVPTRDSYTMAIVGTQERVAMASIHIVGRSIAGTAGPSVATALWNAISASVPFVACSVLKITYDLSLFMLFRNVHPPEEERRRQARVAGKATRSTK
jgi:MFS family permease